MDIQEGKSKFIQAWGTVGTNWGINRTMAQIHAFLLVSPKALNAEEVMEGLKISRGNVNMNLRALIDWGLVYKELIPGERKEFFVAEKNMWEVMKCIIAERKKRELDPMMKALDEISKAEPDGTPESEEFLRLIADINLFSEKADSALNTFTGSDPNWFVSALLKLKL